MTHTVGVLGHDGFIYPNASVVIDVAGFCQPHDGVDENVGSTIAGGSNGKFPVCTMHRVPGLESDDLTPRELSEMRTKFRGGICSSRKEGQLSVGVEMKNPYIGERHGQSEWGVGLLAPFRRRRIA